MQYDEPRKFNNSSMKYDMFPKVSDYKQKIKIKNLESKIYNFNSKFSIPNTKSKISNRNFRGIIGI